MYSPFKSCSAQSVAAFVVVVSSFLSVFGDLVLNNTRTTNSKYKFTIEQLLNSHFPKKISNDFDLDPCKAGEYFLQKYQMSIID